MFVLASDELSRRKQLLLLPSKACVRLVKLGNWTSSSCRAPGPLREVETIAADATALVFAPWGSFGFADLTPSCWSLMPGLRVIAGTFDNRFEDPDFFGEPLAGMWRRGITVIDTSRTMTPLVAEFALLLILSLLRGLPDAVAAVRRGEFPTASTGPDHERFVVGELTGRSIGLAGLGVINRRLADLLQPFRCSVASYDPYVADTEFRERHMRRAESLVELASLSEIFVVGILRLHCLQIIDPQVIEALPSGSLFVLVTRMQVIDQAALWQRTSAGEIRAAIDVFRPRAAATRRSVSDRSQRHPEPSPRRKHRGGASALFRVACEEAIR